MGDSSKGIAAIFVPPQPGSNRPFLIARTVLETGKSSEVVFGYAERTRANAQPRKVADLHALLKNGLLYENHLSRMDEKLDALLAPGGGMRIGTSGPNTETVDVRINDALDAAQLSARPVFILLSLPATTTTVSGLLDPRHEGIGRVLETGRSWRRAGFDLDTETPFRLVRGELLRSLSEGWKVVDLYRDGVLLFGAAADGDFLCWGSRREEGTLFINPLALLEASFLFVQLYASVLKHCEPSPPSGQFRIELRNMRRNDPPISMVGGSLKGADWQFGVHSKQAPTDELSRLVEWAQPLDVSEVTFLLVREVYGWFGFESDAIPYTTRGESSTLVDPDKLLQAGAG